MTARVLASVALKLWGLYLLAGAVASCPISVFILTLSSRGFAPADPARLPGLVAAFITAAILILGSDRIALRVVADDGPAGTGLNGARLGAVVFGLAGVVAMVVGLRDALVAGLAFSRRLSPQIPAEAALRIRDLEGQTVTGSVVLIASGVVILWRERVAAGLRHAGRALTDLHDPPIK